MRVISGEARGRKLKTIEGLRTRPTTDRLKETLFNIINLDIKDSEFLDLYSGSGAIGIEAISRGAKTSYFIENYTDCISVINENLKNLGFQERAFVIKQDCKQFIENTNKKFDLIFMDPPYIKNYSKEILLKILNENILKKDGTIIIEQSSDSELPNINGLEIVKIKKFKTTYFIFIKVVTE